MPHRVFIAINLPQEVKRGLEKLQAEWSELPIRWTKPENLHITLVFLGYISDQELPKICKIVREIAQKHQPFSINLNRICYGPPGKIPRMVWVVGACPELVEGKKIDRLSNLQKDLEGALFSAPIKISKESEDRSYTPHITLGRIHQWEFRKIDPEEIPNVEEGIFLNFEVASIEVMESQLKREGPEYTVLESASLGSSL